jgi:hypothetical protein
MIEKIYQQMTNASKYWITQEDYDYVIFLNRKEEFNREIEYIQEGGIIK